MSVSMIRPMNAVTDGCMDEHADEWDDGRMHGWMCEDMDDINETMVGGGVGEDEDDMNTTTK